MDFEQAEHRYQELAAQRQAGVLDEDQFRVEVAKLLLRDDQGSFWMLNADDGAWFCNRGEGWMPDNPRADSLPEPSRNAARTAPTRRVGWLLAISTVLVLVLVVAIMALLRWPPALWPPAQPTSIAGTTVRVIIASPADGSQVPVGHEVGIESTLDAQPDLQAVARVELQVDGETVEAQPVRPRLQPGQTSLPLSLPWRPAAIGQYPVTVSALSAEGQILGEATVTLDVVEAPDEILPEPACIPGATFLADVTIPPGTAFPPGASMDKVWQVRNNGTCAWGVGYMLALVGGDALGAETQVPVPPTAAGERSNLEIKLTAPDETGPYLSIWQLHSPEGTPFGPTLTLSIEVGILVERSEPPRAPTDLQATVSEDGRAVRLSWRDRSDNEDAFRVYREDVEASIGLARANAEIFVDGAVNCGNTYRYGVVAFNATGASPLSETAEVTLPPCASSDMPPTLALTIVPTQVVASETFTVAFQAQDDLALAQVVVQGEETGDAILDAGRVFTCTISICAGQWPITWTEEFSGTLILVAIARDSTGRESEPARAVVIIVPPE